MPQNRSQPEPTPDCSAVARQALSAGQLTIRSELHGTSHVLAVSGELDLATAGILEDELKNVEATDAADIALDLIGMDFIDSAGVHLVMAAGVRSRADRNRLRLLRAPDHVQRIFDITGTADRLPFAA